MFVAMLIICHFEGNGQQLDKLAQELLGVSISEITNGFKVIENQQ